MKYIVLFCLISISLLFFGSSKYCSTNGQVAIYLETINSLNELYKKNGYFPLEHKVRSVCMNYVKDDTDRKAFVWITFPFHGKLGFSLPEVSQIIGNDSAGTGFHKYIHSIQNEEFRALLDH